MNQSAAIAIGTINGWEGQPSTRPADLALPLDVVKTLFDYDPEEGVLIWKEKPINEFRFARDYKAWMTKHAGRKVTYRDSNGYVRVFINGRLWLAHRIIWMWNYGYLPELQIDHIDHNRQNNRLENLRLVTQSQNNANSRLSLRSVTGVTGVTWHTPSKRWRATINLNKKFIEIGRYMDFESAVIARKAAEKVLGFHENHGSSV